MDEFVVVGCCTSGAGRLVGVCAVTLWILLLWGVVLGCVDVWVFECWWRDVV